MAASSPIFVGEQQLPGLAHTASRYAINQLFGRAGANPEFCQSWRLELTNPAFVDVYVLPGSRKCLRFPRVDATRWNQIKSANFATCTAGWLENRTNYPGAEADFKIPFSSSELKDVGPLFVRESEDLFRCSVDLPLSALLTLCRFEETFSGERDQHGRFSAFTSVAWRDGFLHRPIVDEYGRAIEQVLMELLPGWRPVKRWLRIKLSHDVDELGIPFSFRGAFARTFRDARVSDTTRDLLAPLLGIDTAYQRQLKRIVKFSADRNLNCAVYWKAADLGPHDTGYDPRDVRVTTMITRFRSNNVEMGVHPSYVSFDSAEVLRCEVQTLREVLGEQRLGGRQDYLRWDPQSWVQWDSLGLAYDSSVGFADHYGFRAGTCFPYRPWLWSEERVADLIEIPLHATDSALMSYMKLNAKQSLLALHDLVSRCRAVGGVFALAWHNTRIQHAGFCAIFQKILDELRETPTYDWRTQGI